MGIIHENSNNVEHLENHDLDEFMEFNNDLDSCEYCGGLIRCIQYGYKMDEVAKQCQDCNMVDPR